MSPRWTPTIAVPALALLLLIAGCGGGKDQVTAAELVQKGDQICRHEQSAFNQIQEDPLANASSAVDQTKELIKTADSASSQLDSLEPPDELRPALDSYMSARDRAIDLLKKGEDAAENQDSAAYGAAQTAMVHGAPERRKLAAAVGFKVCGSKPGSA